MSLDPTTLSVLMGWEESGRRMGGGQEVFGGENEALMEALRKYGDAGDVAFIPEGRLGDLVYAMTGICATSGMFHEVQPEDAPDPLSEAELAVVPAGALAEAGAAAAPVMGEARQGMSAPLKSGDWSPVERVGSYVILVREGAGNVGGERESASLPLWAAYLLLAAAAFIIIDAARGKGGPREGIRNPPQAKPMPPRLDGPPRGPALAVVPAYNEEESVGAVVEEIRASCPGMGVLVIDDGSSDLTAAEAARAGTAVIRLDGNLGVGEAERRGLAWAHAHGYGCAVRLDGDGQHPAACIPFLLEPVRRGEADVAVGSRFLAGGAGQGISRARRVGMAFFRLLLRRSTGREFSDPTSGFRAYSGRAMLFLAGGRTSRYPEVVSLRELSLSGLSILEVPVEVKPRRHGHSSLGGLREAAMVLEVALAFVRAPAAGVRADVLEAPAPASP